MKTLTDRHVSTQLATTSFTAETNFMSSSIPKYGKLLNKHWQQYQLSLSFSSWEMTSWTIEMHFMGWVKKHTLHFDFMPWFDILMVQKWHLPILMIGLGSYIYTYAHRSRSMHSKRKSTKMWERELHIGAQTNKKRDVAYNNAMVNMKK